MKELIQETSRWKRPSTARYVRPVAAEKGRLMAVEEYLRKVSESRIIDYDGMGEAVRDGLVADCGPGVNGRNWLLPSEGDRLLPEDATHVLWHSIT